MTERPSPGSHTATGASEVRRAIFAPARAVAVAATVPAYAWDTGRRTLSDAVSVVRQGREVVERAAVLVDALAVLVEEISVVVLRAGTVASMAEVVAVDAAAVVVTLEGQLERTDRLAEVAPEVAELVVPALTGLGRLTPELGELAERFDEIGKIVEGIPGAGLLKRRGAGPDHDTRADASDVDQSD